MVQSPATKVTPWVNQMAEVSSGAKELRPLEKVGKLLEELLEGFEQLEEWLGSFFDHWGKGLEKLNLPHKRGICPSYESNSSGIQLSSGNTTFSGYEYNQQEETGRENLILPKLPPTPPLSQERFEQLRQKLLADPATPGGNLTTLLAGYLVEQLEQLHHQRDTLQAHCHQLELLVAEKNQQLAQLNSLLEEYKRQLLHYHQHWMEQLQLFKPLLDSVFTTLTELPYGVERLRDEEIGESGSAGSRPILPLPALSDRKSSTG